MTKFNCEALCGSKIWELLIPHSDLHLHDIQLVVVQSIFSIHRMNEAMEGKISSEMGAIYVFTGNQVSSAAGHGCHAPISSLLIKVFCS